MTTVAGYDRPIEDLIAELSATGHVTHTKYKKKSVTLHHNGGVRFSHRTILNIWRTRPASAHFDFDAQGAIAQYVEVHEYAWAVGNTQGNCETISLEMANITGAPHWEVADETWQSAARFAGFLFARVIDGRPRPTRNNFFVHKHWSATSCAGPFVDQIYDRALVIAQKSYDHFHKTPTPAPQGDVIRPMQRLLEVEVTGKWDTPTDHRAHVMRLASRAHAGYPHNIPSDFNVEVVQRVLDVRPDGDWGPLTQAALDAWLKQFQRLLGVRPDGKWGSDTENRFLRFRENHLIR